MEILFRRKFRYLSYSSCYITHIHSARNLQSKTDHLKFSRINYSEWAKYRAKQKQLQNG